MHADQSTPACNRKGAPTLPPPPIPVCHHYEPFDPARRGAVCGRLLMSDRYVSVSQESFERTGVCQTETH